jgi:integrase
MRYLFKRKGSDNWYVRLQPPGQKLVERSLGTSDKAAAELAAADVVKQHRAFMYQRRQARVTSVVHGPWKHEHTPGLHTLPDGGHVLATETTLTFTDAAGKITSTRPNGGPAIYFTGGVVRRTSQSWLGGPDDDFRVYGTEHVDFGLTAAQEFDALDGKLGEGPVATERPKFVAAKSSADDALLELYIKHASLTAVREKEARDIWRTFRTVVDKPLARCTRDDGRAVVAALGDVKSATARRKLVPLVALTNLAISEGKHAGINPFVGVVPDRKDSERRIPFDDDDIKLIRANLHRLDERDQLLIRVLATCGLRRGEAFAINREQTENGVRFCMIGSKTEASLRRVPFPKDLLPHLPKKISGPLFTGRLDTATKRLGGFLRDIGIDDTAKSPMHSFRHRCKDKLRAAGTPLDVQYELMGHEHKTVAASYGRGSPMPLLKKWLDKVAF